MYFVELVEDLKSTTIRTKKEELLRYYDDETNRYLLSETFDPNRLHNVTIRKNSLPEPGDDAIEDHLYALKHLFDSLSNSYSSKVNRELVDTFMRLIDDKNQEVLMGVINKKLKMGINIRTINKVFPNLIKVSPIQLAQKYSPDKRYSTKQWKQSLKLDGVRIFCFRTTDDIEDPTSNWHIHSRAKDYIGRELFTLDHWKEQLEQLYQETGCTYYEGEAYKHGWDFSLIQSLVFSTVNLKVKAKELEFHCFLTGRCNGEVRCDNNLTKISLPDNHYFNNLENMVAVKQSSCDTIVQIMNHLDSAIKDGFEGIMLRNSAVLHSPKRDKCLLKVKPSYFKDLVDKWDCEILSVEFDDYTIQENGVVTVESLPVRLVVEQPDGIECKVGSGFKLPFRRWLAAHHEEVVSKTAEIEFCGVGAHGRMRFPIYKRIREDV